MPSNTYFKSSYVQTKCEVQKTYQCDFGERDVFIHQCDQLIYQGCVDHNSNDLNQNCKNPKD